MDAPKEQQTPGPPIPTKPSQVEVPATGFVHGRPRGDQAPQMATGGQMQLELPAELTSRMTINDSVYFQDASGQPISVGEPFAVAITKDEQPWVRKFKAVADWTLLDIGWIEESSCMVLANDEGKRLQTIPTADQWADIQSRIVQVAILSEKQLAAAMPKQEDKKKRTMWDPPRQTSKAEIDLEPEPVYRCSPGRTIRIEPEGLGRLYIRCLNGEARVTLTLIPK